jgi:hypothetical protein
MRFLNVTRQIAVCLAAMLATARADQAIFTDSLQNSWQNWGWATLNYTNTAPVHSGADSVAVTMTSAWQGMQVYHVDLDSSPYTNLVFWLNGGTSGGQKLQVYGLLDTNGSVNFAPSQRYSLGTLAGGNAWTQFTVPLSALGVASHANFTGFVIQDSIGATQATFYVDDISLATNTAYVPPAAATNAPVTVAVDVRANRHNISPLIYGVAFASSNQLADLNAPVNRSGGNSETRYNWQLNAHNHAADYYFESLRDSSTTPGASADDFVANSRNGGAAAMITIPMIGWAPKLGSTGDGRLGSYSIAKYGPQTGNDAQWFPDAGNGISVTNNTPITWNDPNDANVPVNSAFQKNYVQHLKTTWGASTNGGVKFYLMDNEHTLWQSTHQDVHPVGPTMQEIRDKIFDYATMVRTNDPNALICAPEEWGWPGYFNSGYDIQNSGGHDRATNGGMDYMPWLLSQIHQHDTNTGVRLLDYFTLHCYPQEGSVGSSAVDAATALLRNQSTRQFWDTNYVDPSWINNVIMLIPRMKNWVAMNYPGTKIGITEYNWGADADMNGATAQADLLGIFGREGLDLATRWVVPDAGTPTYNAFKMYRNYDGQKSTFGDLGGTATVPNPDSLVAFTAVRTRDNALTVMAINKDLLNFTPATFAITNYPAATNAQVWQLRSNILSRLADISLRGNLLSNTLPAESVTLFVVPAAAPKFRPAAGTSFWLDGANGTPYVIQRSTNLVTWANWSTNLVQTNSALVNPATTGVAGFFRAMWQP